MSRKRKMQGDGSTETGQTLTTKQDTYALLGVIGEGTFSIVYKARSHTDGKLVALKRLKDHRLSGVRVLDEVGCLYALGDHPNVVKIIDACRDPGVHLIMPYIEHDSFSTALDAGRFTIPHITNYMRGLFHALEHIHIHGYIHRDIKPTNVLYSFATLRLLVVDFGLVQCETAAARLHHSAAQQQLGSQAPRPLVVEGGEGDAASSAAAAAVVEARGDGTASNQLGERAMPPPAGCARARAAGSAVVSADAPIVATSVAASVAVAQPEQMTPRARRQLALGRDRGSHVGAQVVDDAEGCSVADAARGGLSTQLAAPDTERSGAVCEGERGSERGGAPEMAPGDPSAACSAILATASHGEKEQQPAVAQQGEPRANKQRSKAADEKRRVSPRLPVRKGVLQGFRRGQAGKHARAPPSRKGSYQLRTLVARREGTKGFRAPEVLLQISTQTSAIDVWSAGVVLLCLLSRRYPIFVAHDDLAALAEITCLVGAPTAISGARSLSRLLSLVNWPHGLSGTETPSQCNNCAPSWVALVEEGTPQTPAALLQLLEGCLQFEAAKRCSAASALQHLPPETASSSVPCSAGIASAIDNVEG